MGWFLFVILQITVIAVGIRREKQAGLWSWTKFLFALAFGALEFVIVSAPLFYFGLSSPHFMTAFIAAWTVAALNFIWLIVVARRWRLPDGRSSLKVHRDQQKN